MRFPWQIMMLMLTGLSASAVAATPDALQSFGPDSMKELVARAGGKPLVVMIWSLDCAYCLPSFKALAQARSKEGIQTATIATDPLDDPESRRLMIEKLEAGSMTGDAWAFGPWPVARLRYAIDPAWRGELPRTYWFVKGRQVSRYSGALTSDLVMKGFAEQAPNAGRAHSTLGRGR